MPGIESLLCGFAIGDIAAVLVEQLVGFRHRYVRKNTNTKLLWAVIVDGTISFCILHYLFKLNSLLSSVALLLTGSITIALNRPDLAKLSLIGGISMAIVASIVMTIVGIITSGFIDAFYSFQNTPGVVLFNLPLNDLLLYFFFGTFFAPLFEF